MKELSMNEMEEVNGGIAPPVRHEADMLKACPYYVLIK